MAARDKKLLARLGTSFATGAFITVRDALFRETVLALTRIWDKSAKDNLKIDEIVSNLTRTEVVAVLKQRRRAAYGGQGRYAAATEKQVEREIAQIKNIQNRIRQGQLKNTVEALIRHRHELLAHRQISAPHSVIKITRSAKYGDERLLLRWTAALCERLNLAVDDLHVHHASDFARYKIAAKCFWGPVRAETIKERNVAREEVRSSRRRSKRALGR